MGPSSPPRSRSSGVTAPPSGKRDSAAQHRPPTPPPGSRHYPRPPLRGSTCGAELWLQLGADWTRPCGRSRTSAVTAAAATALGAEAQEPTGPGRDGAAAAPRRTHALSGPKLGRASPAPPAAAIPAGMMCLECASAAAGGAEEEEADAERRRRRGAQLGASGAGCCGARGASAAGVAAADDEVQTLSGSVRRAPSGPPSTPSTPSCAAAAKGPGAQQPKPASLGRRRGAAAAILSLGNVLNYLDRYTVVGELVPHPALQPGPPASRYPGEPLVQTLYIQAYVGSLRVLCSGTAGQVMPGDPRVQSRGQAPPRARGWGSPHPCNSPRVLASP